MAFSFEILNEQLQSDNTDILELALGQLGRLPQKIALSNKKLLKIAFNLAKEQQKNDNEDVRFLADEAVKHIKELLSHSSKAQQEESTAEKTSAVVPATDTGQKKEEIKNKEKKPSPFRPEMLFSKDPFHRQAAIERALEQKPKDLFRHIVMMIAAETDHDVLALTINALKLIGEHKACPLLHVFLYYENDLVRINAVEAIEKLGHKEDILEMLPPLLKDHNERVKESALRAIARFNTKDIISHLKTMISSEEVSTRTACLFVLSHIKGKSILPLLSIAASDPHTENRLKVIEILGEQKESSAIPILRKLAEDIDIEVSEKAMEILAELENNKTTDDNNETGENTVENDVPDDKADAPLDLEALLKEDKDRKIQEKKQKEAEKAAEELARSQRDTEAIDDAIEKQMLLIGKSLYKMHEMGAVKDERFLVHIYTVQKLKEQLAERLEKQQKGFLKKLKKAFGGIEEQQKIVELESKVEDGYINLGECAYEMAVEQYLEFPEFEENFARIDSLLEKRG
jgi:HEAT repeat protein